MTSRSLLPNIWRGEKNVWNPMREMNRLQRRLDRMFDEYLTEQFPNLFKETPSLGNFEAEFTPACDVNETDTHYLLSFDLPGVKKDEVKIEVLDNLLIVSGERNKEHKEQTKGRVSQEKYYGSFMRSFTLPSDLDANKVEAHFENGVLQIALPKMEMSKGKQIQIKEGKFLAREKEAKTEKAA